MTTAPTPATSSTPAIDPNIPTAARAHTPAGAEAFARHYVDALNQAFKAPAQSELDTLGTPTCKQCATYASSVDSLARQRQRYSGQLISIQDSAAAPNVDENPSVNMRLTQERVALVDASGAVLSYTNRKPASVTVVLQWVTNRWSVSQFRYTA